MPKIYDDYPQSATNNAKRALKWLKENDNPNNCLTPVGFSTARKLANREKLDRETVAKMSSFRRHEKNKDVPYTEGCGGIAWDCWGGTSGINWAEKKIKEIDNNSIMSEIKNFERRNFKNQEIRVEDEKSREVVGYASVFNQLSEPLGGFREQIDPSAFNDVLDNSVRALFNHDPNLILAKSPNTLQLRVDDKGLEYRFTVPEGLSYGEDLLISLSRGDVSQSSFGFIVEEDEWSQGEDGTTIRTIKKVSRLLDVSPVTFPAYPSATSQIADSTKRSFLDFKTELDKKENKKEDIKIVFRNIKEKETELIKLKIK